MTPLERDWELMFSALERISHFGGPSELAGSVADLARHTLAQLQGKPNVYAEESAAEDGRLDAGLAALDD